MSSLFVSPTRGCKSIASTISRAHFWIYSCARCTGLRVWNPTTLLHPFFTNTHPAAEQIFTHPGNVIHARMLFVIGTVDLQRLFWFVMMKNFFQVKDRNHLISLIHKGNVFPRFETVYLFFGCREHNRNRPRQAAG